MNLAELTWPEVQARAPDMPVVIPIAAVEQHGHHLPLVTDSLLLGEIVARVESRLATEVLVAPLQWLGNSHHHLDFPGTLSAAARTYLDLLLDLMEAPLAHGFRRIVLVNGHGGNDVPARQAIFELRQRHRRRRDLLLLTATYWSLGGPGSGPRPWERAPSIAQRSMGHACEWETSMVLRIAPHLVKPLEGLADVDGEDAFAPGVRGWTTGDRTEAGHIGRPRLATADKGEALLATFADDLTAWLGRVIAWDGRPWNP
jgi:creatinine amidohydrolase